MTNKEANKAAKNYAAFMGAKLVRRLPVIIGGIKHQRLTLRYNMSGIQIEKDFQLSEEVLSTYE